ncbi:MAG: branched-chain amino acid transaminase [Gammaproteobacteria bacterium]
MQPTNFIWKNGQMIAWQQAHTHVLAHGLHYGAAVFEGIRCYQTQAGPAVFKLAEHIARFFYSAKQIGMRIPYTDAQLSQAVLETIEQNQLSECYIRPLAYYGYGSMKVTPTADLPIEVIIACWPWGKYLAANAIDVATSKYIRIHPQSTVADAKISGHYINSILAGLAIQNTHYHEALLLDTKGFVAETTAANFFIVKHNKLITTPAGTILLGITRNTVIDIAKELGIEVVEQYFKPEDIYQADEAFCCGTAAEITTVRSLDDKLIGSGVAGNVTQKIDHCYQQVVHGKAPNYQSALTYVTCKGEVYA